MQTRDISFKDGNINTCDQALTNEILSFPQQRSVSHLTITLKKGKNISTNAFIFALIYIWAPLNGNVS